jgi:type IV pilus assembly protein PilE
MKQRGFTLIEVMIVAAVLAILAAIAIPSYQEQVRKGRRADALAAINETAQALERFYTLNNTYAGYQLRDVERQSPRTGDVIFYDITLVSTANSYTITATPRQEDRCGAFSIDNLGNRSAASPDCVR